MYNAHVIKPSKIHGLGAFANRDIRSGEHLTIPNSDIVKRFRGYNHGCNFNVILGPSPIEYIVALRDIKEGEELTVDYTHGGKKSLHLDIANCRCSKCFKH